MSEPVPETRSEEPATANMTRTRERKAPIDVNKWIAYAANSPQRSGRCPENRRFGFMKLSANSAESMDVRRFRNDRVGEATWFEFEAKKIESILKTVKHIVANMTPAARKTATVYMTGNLACRAALCPLATDETSLGVVMQAFPPTIVNISVAISDPRHFGDVASAVDKAVIALKRHMDGGPDRRDASVNSCLILATAPDKAVMVDVPGLGPDFPTLPPTTYSICKNMSSPNFSMTRLRRAVKDGKSLVQIPILDVTIHSEPVPPLVRAPLGTGSVFVQPADTLESYFTTLASDPEIIGSASKIARCRNAVQALRYVFGHIVDEPELEVPVLPETAEPAEAAEDTEPAEAVAEATEPTEAAEDIEPAEAVAEDTEPAEAAEATEPVDLAEEIDAVYI